ncbi:hypothetical protein R1flu_023078 [Riccia fluitans]|uniref:Uncharacterized protein n=1 Tax=Riccia fluitans TaxID=41844 RepID=A0ABD1XTZ4_9MARC
MDRWRGVRSTVLIMIICTLHGYSAGSAQQKRNPNDKPKLQFHDRKLLNPKLNTGKVDPQALVNDSLILTYHNGPLLAGGTAKLYLILYGNWSSTQREIVYDFISSIGAHDVPSPSVASWWSLTKGYTDTAGSIVTEAMEVGGEMYDSTYSLGSYLRVIDIENLVLSSLHPNGVFPTNHHAVYVVLTSPDVKVQDFCKSQCASHFATKPLDATDGRQLIYTWIGNAVDQCPKKCIWPFAPAEFGDAAPALIPPNGDAGIDGMIINIAVMLSGAATNPFNSGYYQGDGGAPLEAATACAGIFGKGAYPGHPGDVLVDQSTGASFNAHGVNGRKYLLPALWNPLDLQCTPPQNV